MRNHGTTEIAPTPTIEERFWGKVDKSGDCWEWLASKNKEGYGNLWIEASIHKAHRYSWELHNGPIPEGGDYRGMCVCHHCDNPSCVNPDHLFISDHKGNMADMSGKDRSNPSKGEYNGRAKLCASTVKLARERYSVGGVTHGQLAIIFGVSNSAMGRAIAHKTWRDV